MTEFLHPSNPVEVEQWSPFIARMAFSTGSEYFCKLFGDAETAVRILDTWIRRPGSEFSGLQATVALSNSVPVGMIISLPGSEVSSRRAADTMFLFKQCKPSYRSALKSFLESYAGTLVLPGNNDYYIRTLAVDPAQQGRGFGKELLLKAIEKGQAAGFNQFRLDVAADNVVAIKLYQKYGFKVMHEQTASALGWQVCSMLLAK